MYEGIKIAFFLDGIKGNLVQNNISYSVDYLSSEEDVLTAVYRVFVRC